MEGFGLLVGGQDIYVRALRTVIIGDVNRIDVIARQLSQLTHNFRTLCERSLSPKQITRTTAPKVIFYFLGTFLVLLFGYRSAALSGNSNQKYWSSLDCFSACQRDRGIRI